MDLPELTTASPAATRLSVQDRPLLEREGGKENRNRNQMPR